MAYPHTEYEVVMIGSGAVALGGRKGPRAVTVGATGSGSGGSARWAPGYTPHVIREVTVVSLGTAVFVTKPVISIRLTGAGATQTTSGNQVTSLTLTSIAASKATGVNVARSVWYKSALLNTIVNPGQDVAAVVTTKASLGPSRGTAVSIVLYVEPKWETPANISNMKTA